MLSLYDLSLYSTLEFLIRVLLLTTAINAEQVVLLLSVSVQKISESIKMTLTLHDTFQLQMFVHVNNTFLIKLYFKCMSRSLIEGIICIYSFLM